MIGLLSYAAVFGLGLAIGTGLGIFLSWSAQYSLPPESKRALPVDESREGE